ncbi:unnamed protein product [Eruca vesicaria subsp. sativa]|uniref:Uncharacterized protein n=1 Tax=Eruca vesicaria subsp. sativa TaxID=29727 RepID=A0ABC8J9K1_ERUVS|nr:unnamed protein product [Eruca vesicaria subsp. sativa]
MEQSSSLFRRFVCPPVKKMASPIIGGRSYGRSFNHRFGSSQEPPSPALSPTHVANSEPSVHMEDAYVVRTSLPMLHHSRQNGSKWFNHNTEVSTAIRKIIQGCFKGPWYSWKKVPPYYKRTWFSMFKAAGMSKQGRVFGLGALHSKILPACYVSSNAPEASEEVEMITQRLQEVEAELKQSREENLQFQKRLENMETLVQSITSLSV